MISSFGVNSIIGLFFDGFEHNKAALSIAFLRFFSVLDIRGSLNKRLEGSIEFQ